MFDARYIDTGYPAMDKETLPARFHARRILIVEDDPGARRSLLLLLTGRGFDAVAFPSYDQALADAATHPPACLIADYRLGDGDGIALLFAMRANGWTGPAILISAYSSRDLSERASAAGFAAIFDKPLREHALVDTVGRLIAGGA
jgi:FixJ family two-component response regulator